MQKLRHKNQQLKVSISKLEKQLKFKNERDGDALERVDLEQLKIQNAQYTELIDGKNESLLEMKLVAGGTVTNLNDAKNRLAKEV